MVCRGFSMVFLRTQKLSSARRESSYERQFPHSAGESCRTILVSKVPLGDTEVAHPQDNYAISASRMLGFTPCSPQVDEFQIVGALDAPYKRVACVYQRLFAPCCPQLAMRSFHVPGVLLTYVVRP